MRYWRRPLDRDQLQLAHGTVQILGERCKGCGFCVEYCPRQVLAMSAVFNRKGYHPPEVIDASSCVACELCTMICPDFAIFCTPDPPTPTVQTPAPPPTPRVQP